MGKLSPLESASILIRDNPIAILCALDFGAESPPDVIADAENTAALAAYFRPLEYAASLANDWVQAVGSAPPH